MSKNLLNLGQWVGAVFLAFGCGVEIAYHADIGYTLITLGSLVFVIATKLKHHKPSKKPWRKLHRHR